jgi:TRAP-type mannitol/chloroaromatic compound transport system permease small subunit
MKMNWVNKANELVGEISKYFILAIAFIVNYDIVARHCFGSPTLWGQELSTMFFGAYIILTGGYIHRYNGHVNMDLAYNKVSRKTKKVFRLISFFMVLLFSGGLLWKGTETAWRSLIFFERTGSMWNPPAYPIKIALPLGALLLFLQEIANYRKDKISWV